MSVREFVAGVGAGELPAYVYDVRGVGEHAAEVRAALGGAAELFYAAKANPEGPVLRAIADQVDGVEVASGGELRHVLDQVPGARIVFGGPGKTDEELRLAVRAGVERIHVESPYELRRLIGVAEAEGRDVEVLLRVNLAGDRQGVALAMTGPFGMDPGLIGDCLPLLAAQDRVRLRGVHAHLASGLQVDGIVRQQREILDWGRPWLAAAGVRNPEFNLGGGMGVDYADPSGRFDWPEYGRRLRALRVGGETFRIEPGRSISVHHGWYVTDVLDLKQAHGHHYAVLRGGTHHLRTPVTKAHDQPFEILHRPTPDAPRLPPTTVTLVGQLCTPKDVFARARPVPALSVGDLITFHMAGAYAWNISHHDFLMHPEPTVHYLNA